MTNKNETNAGVAGASEGGFAVGADDLPLICPRPHDPLWSQHPRVFLDVLTNGHATCPYCGTRYIFTGAPPKKAH